MKFKLNLLLLLTFGCSQPEYKSVYSVHPEARKLNDSAVYVAMHHNDYAKAVELLDQATDIDSNYLGAYRNKLSFQGLINPFNADKMLVILKSLNRLRPEDPQYYINIGIIYYKKGDTVSSSKYFSNAVLNSNNILDTMHATTRGYEYIIMNKAYTLFFLGQEQQARTLLQKVYETTQDSVVKKVISQALNKTRNDIISELMSAY